MEEQAIKTLAERLPGVIYVDKKYSSIIHIQCPALPKSEITEAEVQAIFSDYSCLAVGNTNKG